MTGTTPVIQTSSSNMSKYLLQNTLLESFQIIIT